MRREYLWFGVLEQRRLLPQVPFGQQGSQRRNREFRLSKDGAFSSRWPVINVLKDK